MARRDQKLGRDDLTRRARPDDPHIVAPTGLAKNECFDSDIRMRATLEPDVRVPEGCHFLGRSAADRTAAIPVDPNTTLSTHVVALLRSRTH